jgi:hypothetical protein
VPAHVGAAAFLTHRAQVEVLDESGGVFTQEPASDNPGEDSGTHQ